MPHMPRRFRAAIVLALSTCAFTALPGAAAEDDPNASVHSVEYFPSFDGVMLHADVWRPAAAVESGARTPVILTVSPYAGSGGHALSPNPLGGGPVPWGDHFARGVSRAIVSLRGSGASGGCMDLFGPNEIGDSTAAVEHFADTSDGRWTGKVGMVGSSYDGFTQIAAMSAKAKGLAVVIAGAPPVGYHNFFHNRVRNTGGGHGFAPLYAASDMVQPSLLAPPEEHLNAWSSPTADGCLYAPMVLGSYGSDPESAHWQARNLLLGARGSSVPTIWRQGFNDWQVRPTGFVDIFGSLTGPRLGIFGPWDHGAPEADDGKVIDEITSAWLAHYLLDGPAPTDPDVLVQDFDGSWRAESAWPPTDTAPFAMPLRGGTFHDRAGNNGETGLPAAFSMFPVEPPMPLRTGEGIWSMTPKLAHEVHMAGIPEVTASIRSLAPGVHAVAIVYDIDDAGMARMVTRGVTVVRPNALGPSAGEVTFDLYPQDWRFAPGHRIGVLLTGSDDVWFEPGTTGTPVDVVSATISLPVLECLRIRDLEVGPFNPRAAHEPFRVDAATVAAATVDVSPPSADAPRGNRGRCTDTRRSR